MGVAVDLTLVDLVTGTEVPMGTPSMRIPVPELPEITFPSSVPTSLPFTRNSLREPIAVR